MEYNQEYVDSLPQVNVEDEVIWHEIDALRQFKAEAMQLLREIAGDSLVTPMTLAAARFVAKQTELDEPRLAKAIEEIQHKRDEQ